MPFIKDNKKMFPFYIISILLLSVIIFFETWKSLVEIWDRSDTYAHGFLVIPGSLWLIWQNKSLHPHIYPTKPSITGISFLLLNGVLWLFASITQTLVIQQLALVSMLIGSYWFFLGNITIRKIVFPTVFLYFMVPMGEAQLLPYLMEFTASFTIALVRLSGLSVYREGLHFSLVSGDWSVVEACSGVRYLISSITLGTIYAYITYSKNYKRTVFILCSIIVPVFANGLRAYMIVMIGHFSDMKLATGVDHLVYGAFFFAIIIFIMFYIGSFWKDTEKNIISETPPTLSIRNNQTGILLVVIFFSFALWPFSVYQLQSRYKAITTFPDFSATLLKSNWHETSQPSWEWQPQFSGTTTQSLKYFTNGDSTIGVYRANFGDEKQGAELVNTQHVLVQKDNRNKWNDLNHKTLALTLKDSSEQVYLDTSTLKGENSDILTAKWYQIGEFSTNNPYLAKIKQLYKRITLNNSIEIYYVVFSNQPAYKNDNSEMQNFITSIILKQ